MGRAETKYQNAALKMNAALIELLEEKEFQNITVLEICKKAEVNRSTFYAHYSNTSDLLEELHNNLTDKMNAGFGEDIEELKKSSGLISRSHLVSYLEFIKEHKNFFKTYMTNVNNSRRQEFYSLVNEIVFFPILKKNNITDKTSAEYIARFYMLGLAEIIRTWVYNDCTDNIDLIADVIMKCFELKLKND